MGEACYQSRGKIWNKWTVCLPCGSACAVSNILRLPGEVPSDAPIGGIAVRLDRPLDDTTRQQILDAANTIASFSGRFEGDQAMSGEDLERSLAMMAYTPVLQKRAPFAVATTFWPQSLRHPSLVVLQKSHLMIPSYLSHRHHRQLFRITILSMVLFTRRTQMSMERQFRLAGIVTAAVSLFYNSPRYATDTHIQL